MNRSGQDEPMPGGKIRQTQSRPAILHGEDEMLNSLGP
jgi:hypothetical protein